MAKYELLAHRIVVLPLPQKKKEKTAGNMKEEYFQLDMSNAEQSDRTTYMDGDIALLNNTNELPNDHNCIKLNIFIIVACLEGQMSISINSRKHTLHAQELLLCMPNAVLNDYAMSSDFNGKILCLSSRAISETMRMDNELWNKAFLLKENPIIHVDQEGIELFHAYNAVVALRNQASQRIYSKEVMTSLVRALLYEILSELSEHTGLNPTGYRKQLREKDDGTSIE